MPFDDIARDFGGVAGGEIVRHPEPGLDRVEVLGVQDLGREPGLLEMLHPAGTAAATRILVDRDERFGCGEEQSGWQRGRAREQHAPARQMRTAIWHGGTSSIDTN